MESIRLILLFILLSCSPAWACMIRMSPEDKFENSDYVFLADTTGCEHKQKEKSYKLIVKKVWKGPPKSNFETTISCATNLLENQVEYLIYAKKTESEDIIHVYTPGSACLRSTRTISNFEASIRSFFSMFDGIPGTIDYRLDDFDYLGKPKHVIEKR